MAFVSISIMKWTFTNQCSSIHDIIFVRSSQIIAGCEIMRWILCSFPLQRKSRQLVPYYLLNLPLFFLLLFPLSCIASQLSSNYENTYTIIIVAFNFVLTSMKERTLGIDEQLCISYLSFKYTFLL